MSKTWKCAYCGQVKVHTKRPIAGICLERPVSEKGSYYKAHVWKKR